MSQALDNAGGIRTETRARVLGMAFMCLCAFSWSLLEIMGECVRVSDRADYQAIRTIWSRYGVHMLFMLIVFGPRKRGGLIKTKRPAMQISRSLLMLGMPVAYLLALRWLGWSEVWSVFWISSLMMMAMAVLILRERVGWRLWTAGAVGFVGVLLMFEPHFPGVGPKALAAGLATLGMAFCYCLYKVMTRMMRDEDHMGNLFHTALWVFLILSLAIPFIGLKFDPAHLVLMVLMGLTGWAVLFFLDRSLCLAPLSLTAPFIYVQPVTTRALRFVLFHQNPDIPAMAGAVIVLGVMIWIFLKESHPREELAAAT